ncbi:RNase H domain-containing protein [Caerostris darwini]|uniref:RNase H domain-containing protein n=1 Tax=Caerostris darwini TaxID=1538125 RepID=A0AAV4M944_9ARAC|nr:RNase H domain-containing protein [Caerostris darwini]
MKAHIGTTGNEIADVYTKQGTKSDNIDIQVKLPPKFIKNLIHKDIKVKWQHSWSTSEKGREVFEIFPLVSAKRLHGNFFLNQIITGLGVIASYQSRFFKATDICSCGPMKEDRHHIIFVCNKWNDIRGTYFPSRYKTLTLK